MTLHDWLSIPLGTTGCPAWIIAAICCTGLIVSTWFACLAYTAHAEWRRLVREARRR